MLHYELFGIFGMFPSRLFRKEGVLAKRKPGINKVRVELCTVFLLEHKGQPQTVIISDIPSIRQME